MACDSADTNVMLYVASFLRDTLTLPQFAALLQQREWALNVYLRYLKQSGRSDELQLLYGALNRPLDEGLVRLKDCLMRSSTPETRAALLQYHLPFFEQHACLADILEDVVRPIMEDAEGPPMSAIFRQGYYVYSVRRSWQTLGRYRQHLRPSSPGHARGGRAPLRGQRRGRAASPSSRGTGCACLFFRRIRLRFLTRAHQATSPLRARTLRPFGHDMVV